MGIALYWARPTTDNQLRVLGQFPAHLKGTTEQIFNLGNDLGYEGSAHGKKQTGSLAEGKLADIVVFDSSSPGNYGLSRGARPSCRCQALEYSRYRDSDDQWVHQKGSWPSVAKRQSGIAPRGEKEPGGSDVAKNLVINRERAQDRISKLDMAVGKKGAHWDVAY